MRRALVWRLICATALAAHIAAPFVAKSWATGAPVNDAPGVIVVEARDARTHLPLQCLTTILLGTKWGMGGDSTGRVRLVYPKIGAARLKITQLGFRDTVIAVTFGNALPVTLRCELTQSWPQVPRCDEFSTGCFPQPDVPPELPEILENALDTANTNLRFVPDTAHVFRSRPSRRR